MTPPAHPEIGVIALVPDRFGGTWQLRHQLLTRLAAYFHVVWMDPAVPWRGARPAPRGHRDDTAPGGLQVYRSGRLLPQRYREGVLQDTVERLRLRRAAGLLRRAGARRIVLYLWRPEYAAALDRLPHDLACYHIDDEYSFSSEERPIDPRERGLIERADTVFIHSRTLFQKKGGLNPDSRVVSNGVDFAAYADDRAEPADLAAIPRPRIGYTGMLKPQLDWALLDRLAAARPDASFVLVGPRGALGEVEPLLSRVVERPNVYELGGRAVADLPAYVQHFDVGILPYAVNDYTRYIYPLKLHEYLAAGIPAVSAAVPAVEEFGEVVRIARTPDGWEKELASALDPAEAARERRAARQAVARSHDWSAKVRQVATAMAEGLGFELPAPTESGP